MLAAAELIGVDGPLGLGGLVAALTNGSGNVSVPLHGGVSGLSLGGLGTLSVELLRLDMGGLDSLSELQLLPPPRAAPPDGAHTLSLGANLSSLDLALEMRISLAPHPNGNGSSAGFHAPALNETFRLLLRVRRASLGASLLLALNASSLVAAAASAIDPNGDEVEAGAEVVQLTAQAMVEATEATEATVETVETVQVVGAGGAGDGSTGTAPRTMQCLLGAAVIDAYLREITLRFDYAVVGLRPLGGDLENDVAALLDGLLIEIESRFAPLIERAVAGAVGGPLRDAANAAAASLLTSWRAGCPPPPPPAPPPLPAPPVPPGAIDWRETPLARAAELMEAVGAPLADHLIDALTNGTGALPPLGPLPPSAPLRLGPISLTAEVHALGLSGLDSLMRLLPLAPLPSDGLGLISTAEMREVTISLDASLNLALPASWPVAPPPPLRLRLRLHLASLGLAAAGRLALRPSVVGALPLRALAAPGCLASAVALAALDHLSLNATLASITLAANDWRASPWPPAAAFEIPISLAAPPPVAAALAATASRAAARWLRTQHNTSCTAAAAPPPPPAPVDLRASRLVRTINHLSRNAPLDQMVDRLCSALQLPPGELQLPATLMARTLHDAKLGAIGIALSDLRLSGLDGFGNVSLLEPQDDDGALLHHSVGLGAGAALSLRLALNLTLDDVPHAFEMGVTLSNVTLRLATRSTIDASSLGGLTLGELLHRPACAAAPLLNLSLDASYTGLAIATHGELLITASADGTGPASAASTPPLASTALTPSAIPPELARGLLAALTPGAVALANERLAAALASQHAACSTSTHGPAAPPPPPAPPLPPPPPLPPLAAASVPAWVSTSFAAAFGAMCAAAAVLALCSVARLRRRQRIGVSARVGGGGGIADSGCGGGGGSGGCYLQPNACLAAQPPVTKLGLRLALPLLLLANGCLFAAANTGDGGELGASVALAGQPMTLSP